MNIKVWTDQYTGSNSRPCADRGLRLSVRGSIDNVREIVFLLNYAASRVRVSDVVKELIVEFEATHGSL